MAALRVRLALIKAKPWECWGSCRRKVGKFGGFPGIRIIEHNNSLFSSSLSQPCRHYFLPPPPHLTLVDFPSSAYRSVIDDRVISAADYAVKFLNESQGGDVRFVRIVRANVENHCGFVYYITLEAIDNKTGELNVYYAEVLGRSLRSHAPGPELMRWQLVDESFSYPFREIRSSDRVRKDERLHTGAFMNDIMKPWLDAMEKRSTIHVTYIGQNERNPSDPFSSILAFERKYLANIDVSLPRNASYAPPTATSDSVVPVYDIRAYGKAYDCAVFAVNSHNKDEDDEIHLEEVLWASKSKAADGVVHYFLLLEAMDGKREINFYYAIIKHENQSRGGMILSSMKLTEWHLIEESSYPLQEDQRQTYADKISR